MWGSIPVVSRGLAAHCMLSLLRAMALGAYVLWCLVIYFKLKSDLHSSLGEKKKWEIGRSRVNKSMPPYCLSFVSYGSVSIWCVHHSPYAWFWEHCLAAILNGYAWAFEGCDSTAGGGKKTWVLKASKGEWKLYLHSCYQIMWLKISPRGWNTLLERRAKLACIFPPPTR